MPKIANRIPEETNTTKFRTLCDSFISKLIKNDFSCRLCIEKVVLWSYSTITLRWIKSPSNMLTTFVSNSH